MKTRKYRINRDAYTTRYWAVEVWRVWWPFWMEERSMLTTKKEAEELLEILEKSCDNI
jgi:hypothetical protein